MVVVCSAVFIIKRLAATKQQVQGPSKHTGQRRAFKIGFETNQSFPVRKKKQKTPDLNTTGQERTGAGNKTMCWHSRENAQRTNKV